MHARVVLGVGNGVLFREVSSVRVPVYSIKNTHTHTHTHTRTHARTRTQTGLEAELAGVHQERVAVMDTVCDLLSDIPSSQLCTMFGVTSDHIQRKLALRYDRMIAVCVCVCAREILCILCSNKLEYSTKYFTSKWCVVRIIKTLLC